MADDSRDAHQAARPAGHVIGFLMPGLTGLEVAAAIRARQELHDPNRDDQRVRDAGRRAAGHRGGAALHVQARHLAQFGAMMAQVGERAEAPREGGQASPNTPPPAKPGRYRRLNPVWLVAVPTKVQATKVQLIPLGNRNILVGTS